MIGRRLLHYEITEKLGEGGMGVVYKARDTRLGRSVALKVLLPDKVADADRRRRFILEARAASALNHPNIVAVHDIGSENGCDFIAMESVEGKTLDQLIPRSGMRLAELLRIAIQIADALACAHAAGIVHRDLKPSNVMVDERGHVKVLDFGLSKLAERAAPQDGSTATVDVKTAEGTIVGTVPYMSPEQAEGKPVDPRSDIFSLGSLLYEMATGRRAFHGDTPVATLSAILQQETEPLEGVPSDLQKLIARCLRKNRERRIQHMDDVRVTLEDLKEDSDSGKLVAPCVQPRRRRYGTLAVCATACFILLAIVAAWFLGRRDQSSEGPDAPTPLTSYPGYEVQPSFSPDGNQVAFAWDGEKQDNFDIYVKLIGSEKPLRLTTDPSHELSPVWSPDGRFIAFVRGMLGDRKPAVYVTPAIGGQERLVAELEGFPAPGGVAPPHSPAVPFPLVAWADGGRSLLLVDRPSPQQPFGIDVVSLESGERRSITSVPAGSIGDGAPAIASDGQALVLARGIGMSSCDLYRLPLTSGLQPAALPERLTALREWSATPVWIPGAGDILFSTGGKFDGPYRLWRIAARAGADPKVLAAYDNSGWPAYSAARSRLVFSRSATDMNIWRLPLLDAGRAGTPEKLIASTRDDAVPQYSLDGSKIVFTSNRSGQHEVWVSAGDGSNAVQLTSLRAGMTGSPHWSPDGKQIVFDSNVEGQFEIYRVNPAGGTPHRLTTHASDDALANYSRDGRFIYFSSNRTGSWQIYRMPAEGGDPVQITQQGGRAALESPDGRFLYYEQGPPVDLWRCRAGGGEETQIATGVTFLNHALTDKGVYFISRPDVESAATLRFLPYTATTSRPVLEIANPVATGLSVSPDGKSLLFVSVDQRGSDLMLVENFR